MSEIGVETFESNKKVSLKNFIEMLSNSLKGEPQAVTARNSVIEEPVIYDDDGKIQFISSGLYAQLNNMDTDMSIELPDESSLEIRRGTIVGQIDFLPFGNEERNYIEGTRTIAVAKALEAFREFFRKVEDPNKPSPEKPLPYPEYLLGFTNPRMAHFARRLGFQIFGQEPALLVLGNTDIVRQRVDEYANRYDKLAARSSREQHRLEAKLGKD